MTVQVRQVVDNDFGSWFERYADQVRHPALGLGLFTTEVCGEPVDARVDDCAEVPAEQMADARRRRGALVVAANIVFDRVVDDLAVTARADVGFPEVGERFVDELFPPQYRHMYDDVFHRKLIATIAKVSCDLASPVAVSPACTAEELVLWAILQQWQSLLEMSELGPPWTDLTDDLFDDLDFETLYAPDLDGIENDPLAHMTTGLVVNAIADWFVPFSEDSVVSPYAVQLVSTRAQLYDLTVHGEVVEAVVADPIASGAPGPIWGLEPVSELVSAARDAARTRPDRGRVWVPDERDPQRSLAEIAVQAGTSGVLTLQPGPDAEITEVPVLEFSARPAHPVTGQAWAEVFYMSGRSELPLNAVVCFEPDPTVRERWETIFRALS